MRFSWASGDGIFHLGTHVHVNDQCASLNSHHVAKVSAFLLTLLTLYMFSCDRIKNKQKENKSRLRQQLCVSGM